MQIISHVLFLKSFLVSHFTFKSRVNFCKVWGLIKAHLFCLWGSITPALFVEGRTFFHWTAFASLSKVTGMYLWIQFGFLFCSIDSCVYSSINTPGLDYCPYISVKLSRVNPTIFFFSKLLHLIPVLCLSIQILRNIFSISTKMSCWYFDRKLHQTYFSLERIDIFTMLSLSNLWTHCDCPFIYIFFGFFHEHFL